MTVDKVDIRPGVGILSVLKHLNYRPWFAIAEFVDNSLQSYKNQQKALEAVEGTHFKLRVEVDTDSRDNGRITIRDNAAGISRNEYARAFRPAAIPPDNSGLAEFGMGMKSAACWFSPLWTVRTTALGEDIESEITFDINRIVRDDLQELLVTSRPTKSEYHFTEISLNQLYKPPQGRTLSKIKEHLASIYRVFTRNGKLDLSFDGDLLIYTEPKVLSRPYYKTPNAEPQLWRKSIHFDFGNGLGATGFAALRETASLSHAGLALFRRGRLIQGSADESYRPEMIFGKSNSFTYQRLFGELELEGFEVSHTKDGFRWDENEEPFLQLLKETLDDDELPLLRQAEGHRVRQKSDISKQSAELATRRTADAIEHEVPPVLQTQLHQNPEITRLPHVLPGISSLASTQERILELDGVKWKIVLELSDDPAITDWLTVSDNRFGIHRDADGTRVIFLRLSLAHPFMDQFTSNDADSVEPLLRVAVALGLGEVAAREMGATMAGTIRRNVNELLRKALAKP